MAVHTNRDPMTGRCMDCGARQEAIDDNLFPTCEKIIGPHRDAIILLRHEEANNRCRADGITRSLMDYAPREGWYSKAQLEAQRGEAMERAMLLRASIALLQGNPDKKPLSLVEAVQRL